MALGITDHLQCAHLTARQAAKKLPAWSFSIADVREKLEPSRHDYSYLVVE
jgi:hypothetical protein